MIVRSLLVGLIALGSVAGAQSQVKQAQSRYWLVRLPTLLADMPDLAITNQSNVIRVVVFGPPQPDSGFVPRRQPTARPLVEMNLQVWVLRKNGTALAPRPGGFSGGTDMGGWLTEGRTFEFEDAEREDISGVAVSFYGKLFVRDMPPK